MMAAEPDSRLQRIERRALGVFAIAIVIASVSGGGMRGALGVIGGALLVVVSYRAIQAGVDAAVNSGLAGNAKRTRLSTVWRLVTFITRFAMLGVIAYVMMVRLRAHPVWMLVGASSLVAAAALEAVRAPRARPLDRQAPAQGHGPTDNEL
jgi:hypothetical protein